MLPRNVRIFVATQPVDFRGSFDRLSAMVCERLKEDPRGGALFVFHHRAGNRLEILFFDQTGDCILYKRFDRRTIHGIVSLDMKSQRIEIEPSQLRELLIGIRRSSKRQFHGHTPVQSVLQFSLDRAKMLQGGSSIPNARIHLRLLPGRRR